MCTDTQTDAAPSGGVQPGGPAIQGPDMGQPHFSEQMPGAAPYQGAPTAGAYQQPQAGYYYVAGAPGQPVNAYPAYGQPQAAPWPPQGAAQPQQALFPPPAQGTVPGADTAAPAGESDAGQHYGELYGLIQEAADGNPDVSKFMNFFSSTSSDFWKGALIGTGLTLVLTNDTVKSAIASTVGGLWGAVSGGKNDTEAQADAKTAGEK